MSSQSADSNVFVIDTGRRGNSVRADHYDRPLGCNVTESDSDGENFKEVIWSKGDECLAYYSGEDIYYEAHIVQLIREGAAVTVVVKYDGYDSDENEQLALSQIRRRPRRRRTREKKVAGSPRNDSQSSYSTSSSMFSPLSGKERERQLSAKFSRQEYEEDDQEALSKISDRLEKRASQQSKASQRKRAKAVVASGGEEKQTKSDEGPVRKLSSPSPKIPSPRIDISQASTKREEDGNVSQLNKSGFDFEGFDDVDMEKPHFSHVPSHVKVPLVLCKSPLIQVPATLNQFLRDYQREGVQFLYSHYREGHGAILGDDMGLGKTVQVIAFLAALLKKTGTREDVLRMKPKFIREMSDTTKDFEDATIPAFLIVCPGSVLYNWADELETWGHFRYSCYHLAAKEKTLASLRKGKLEIVLTTFDTFRENFDELNTYNWNAVVVDEAHKIKGLKAQVTEALRSIHTKRRYGLTGTALQNNMTELWAILDWANPNCLGTYSSFSFHYIKKIERGQKQDATKRELAEARKSKEKFSSLRAKWMLRRTKALLAGQIPKKDDKVVYCKLPEFQATVYEAVLNHEDVKLILTKHKPCPCGSGNSRGTCCYKKNKLGYSMRSLTFSYMHLLLKTANHVALLIPKKTTSERQQVASKEICEVAFERFPEFVNQAREASFRTLSDPKYCGKMKVLQGMLSVFKKERSKVLLFSYSTKLLDILEQYVLTKGYEFRRLDGKVNEKKRHVAVREFNRDPDIFLFLISTKAGSLGLNLTGANVVVIFDPNWNPTHDLQAQDRAYRIGQRRDVRVYRLISTGTIEENMYLRQIYKQQLDNVAVGTENARRYFVAVQGDKSQRGELFGIENMFSMRLGETCLTHDIFERNKKIETALGRIQVADYITPSESEPHSKIAEADGKEGSEDEISLTPESDLDMTFESENENEEENNSVDEPPDSVRDDKLSQIRPQGATECDNEIGTFMEFGNENDTSDEDSNILDSLFDFFAPEPRKQKPKHKKYVSPMKGKVKDNIRSGVDLNPHFENSDEFGETKTRKSSNVTVKTTGGRSTAKKVKKTSPLKGNGLKEASPCDTFNSFWENSEEFGKIENSNVKPKVKGKIVNSTAEGKRIEKFSFFSEKTDNKKLTGVNKSRTNVNMIDDDVDSLMREFDSAIESSKNANSPKVPKGKKNSKITSVRSGKKDHLEPRPSTSGVKTNRRKRDDSSDDDTQFETGPSPVKSGKFTRLKTSPNEELDNGFCDRKGKGVGKKSKPKDGDIGAKSQVEKQQGDFKQPGVSLKKKSSTSDMDGSFSSITDVFDRCGVVHIHENKKVIGASKAEDHMSRCAIQAVFELQQYSQVPAVECDPISEPEEEVEEPEPEPKKRKPSKPRNRQPAKDKPTPLQTVTVGNKKVFIGQTPRAIRRLHFSKMAKHNKMSEIEFARKVASSSSVKQQKLLRSFYLDEDSDLTDVIKDPDVLIEEAPEIKPTQKAVKKGPKLKPKLEVTKRKPVPPSRRGCVYDDSNSDDAADVATITHKQRGTSRSKQTQQLSKNGKNRDDRKWNAFQDACEDFSNYDKSNEDSDKDGSDSVTGSYKVKTERNQNRSKLHTKRKVGKRFKYVLSRDEDEGKADDVATTKGVLSSDVSENFNTSVAEVQNDQMVSSAAASLFDDLFTAPLKRKAPPKRKPADKLAEQSSIFDDIFH